MPGLPDALRHTFGYEGGTSNHASDRGGLTSLGVTQATYNRWLKLKGRPRRSVRNITHEEAVEVYRDLFWEEVGINLLPWPWSFVAFDAGVNHGPARGVKFAQIGLGFRGNEVDGVAGSATIRRAHTAMRAGDARALVNTLKARADFYTELIRADPSQLDFLKGWWRRTLDVLAVALVEAMQADDGPPAA